MQQPCRRACSACCWPPWDTVFALVGDFLTHHWITVRIVLPGIYLTYILPPYIEPHDEARHVADWQEQEQVVYCCVVLAICSGCVIFRLDICPIESLYIEIEIKVITWPCG